MRPHTKIMIVHFYLLFILVHIGCSEKREKVNNLDERIIEYIDNGTLFQVSGKPFTGVMYEEFPLGQLKYEYEIRKGKLHGKFVSYYENGQIKETGLIDDIYKDKKWVYYNEEGILTQEIYYKNRYIEKYFTYYINSNVEEKGVVVDDVIRLEYFYENGNKKETGYKIYKNDSTNDNKTNEWVYYYENGQIESIGKYILDSKDGLWLYYYANGQLKEKGEYSFGKKIGSWEYYKDNGEVINKFQHRN